MGNTNKNDRKSALPWQLLLQPAVNMEVFLQLALINFIGQLITWEKTDFHHYDPKS